MPLPLNWQEMSPRERAAWKATLLAQASVPLSFTHDGITVRLAPPLAVEDDMLRVVVEEAWDAAGNPIPLDNPYYFFNPPLMIPDGTFRAAVDPLSGLPMSLPNYREDHVAVVKQMIVDVLQRPARSVIDEGG